MISFITALWISQWISLAENGKQWYLKFETLRFSGLKRKMPDITEKMLSIQLKALEKDGLINREVYGEKPPIRVEYSLTDFGRTLVPVLDAIAKWGRELGYDKGEMVVLDNN